MRRYELLWMYIGMQGVEAGKKIVRAVSPSEAERKFYRTNRPAWKTCDGSGYFINSIREV